MKATAFVTLDPKSAKHVCISWALTIAGLQHSCHISTSDEAHAAVPWQVSEEQCSVQTPQHIYLCCIGFEGWIACVHLFGTNHCLLAAFMPRQFSR